MNLLNTNIDGFDKILRGGFLLPPRYNKNKDDDVNGLVVLIKGEAGTGKSTLAMQIARGLFLNDMLGTNINHYSLEQNSNDLEIKFIKMWLSYILTEGLYEDLIKEVFKYNSNLRFFNLSKLIIDKCVKFNVTKSKNIFDFINDIDVSEDVDSKFSRRNWIDIIENIMDKLFVQFEKYDPIKPIIMMYINDNKNWQERLNNISDSREYNRSLKQYLIESFVKIFLVPFYLLKSNLSFNDIEMMKGKTSLDQSPLVNALFMVDHLLDLERDRCDEIVVIDGLNIMTNEERRYVNLHNLVKLLRRKAAVSIIVYEPGNDEDNSIEYLVDTTVELRGVYTTEGTNYQLHDLRIPKSRYQNAVLGWQQYKIREYGLDVYPSIHFQVHKQNVLLNEYDKSLMSLKEHIEIDKLNGADKIGKHNSGSIVEDLLDGLMPGSTTVVMGTRGTFKSTLTLDFLYAGAKDKENGLLVSLIDNEDTTKDSMKCCREFNDNEKLCEDCKDNIYLFHQRPGCITSAELLNAIVKRLEYSEAIAKEKNNESLKIKRIAFWDLTQLEHRFPFIADDKMFIPALMDLCRDKKITLVIMGSENNKFSKSVAAMADNIVFVWRDQIKTEGILSEELVKTIEKFKIEIHGNEIIDKKKKKNKNILDNNSEYLALLVERSEGLIGSEGKKLKLLGIGASKNGGFDIKVDKPLCSDIFKEYKRKKTSKKRSEVIEKVFNTYAEVKKSYWKCLENAPDKIKTITNIQGMKSSID